MSRTRGSMMRVALATVVSAAAVGGVVAVVAEPAGNESSDGTRTAMSTTGDVSTTESVPSETTTTVEPVVQLPPSCGDQTIAIVVRPGSPTRQETLEDDALADSPGERLVGYELQLGGLTNGWIGRANVESRGCLGGEAAPTCSAQRRGDDCVVGVVVVGPFIDERVALLALEQLRSELEIYPSDALGVWRLGSLELPGRGTNPDDEEN